MLVAEYSYTGLIQKIFLGSAKFNYGSLGGKKKKRSSFPVFYQWSLKEVQIKGLRNTATTNQNVKLLMHNPLLQRHQLLQTDSQSECEPHWPGTVQPSISCHAYCVEPNWAEVKLESNLEAWCRCGTAVCTDGTALSGWHPEHSARWDTITFRWPVPSFALFHYTHLQQNKS